MSLVADINSTAFGLGGAGGTGSGGGGYMQTFLPQAPSPTEDQLANLPDWQWDILKTQENLEAQNCMLSFWTSPTPKEPFCNATWDTYLCWPATPANSTAVLPCPSVFGAPLNDTEAVAHRMCTSAGQWQYPTWTNYSLCVIMYIATLEGLGRHDGPLFPDDDVEEQTYRRAIILRDIYFFGSILSCVLLLITLFIFSYFKSLQCNRICIHKNLTVSFIVRCLLTIVLFEPFVTGRQHSYRDVDWLCKLLRSLLQYSIVANIFWMFVEGLFLHNRVAVSVFNSEAPFKVFYVVGWGLPALIIAAWALCMHKWNREKCWNKYYTLPYTWIILLPIIVALAVNAFFLVNIIRILITKLRANNTVETAQVRKAVKATAILFPLLGMTNVLFFYQPNDSDGWMMAYQITNAILQSSQGVFVSVVYCFWNAEVRIAILRRWRRYRTRRMGSGRGRRRSSVGRTSTIFVSNNGELQPYSTKVTTKL